MQAVVEAVRKTLERTPAELFSDIAEGGIVLCGGGTRLRLLADLLRYKIGMPVSVAREPHKCAAVGRRSRTRARRFSRPRTRPSENFIQLHMEGTGLRHYNRQEIDGQETSEQHCG